MRILVTGANGFIGAHVAAGLLGAGHQIVACARNVKSAQRQFPHYQWLACDFNRDVTSDVWLPRLDGVDSVVNCAGILEETRKQSLDAVHRAAPSALFDACPEKGIRRVVQISALGADPEAGTEYADSKRAGDTYLKSLDLDWVVVQPSLVIAPGSYGGTSLMRGLAGFPFVVPMPGRGGQKFRPIHMDDLARAVCRLVEADAPSKIVLQAVGAEEKTVEEILTGLRRWLGFKPAPSLPVPMGLIRLAGRMRSFFGWFAGGGPMSLTSVRQTEYGSSADVAPFAEAIGFKPDSFEDGLARRPSFVQDRWHARLYFVAPLLRIVLAFGLLALGLLGLAESWNALHFNFAAPTHFYDGFFAYVIDAVFVFSILLNSDVLYLGLAPLLFFSMWTRNTALIVIILAVLQFAFQVILFSSFTLPVLPETAASFSYLRDVLQIPLKMLWILGFSLIVAATAERR